MATVREWVSGARPRTLPAAAAPVILGTGAAAGLGSLQLGRAGLALGVALALQVGVNYANDYSDGIRGTDARRVGPRRLVATGAASPQAVKGAAQVSFAFAALFGFALTVVSSLWWLLGIGALAILAAWGYTGGRNPYGYRGLGDVMVFVFFGLVATLGTTYTQSQELHWTTWLGAIGIGLLACALLMVNNLRDIPTDSAAGKRTLAVMLGERKARQLYAGYVIGALALGLVCLPATPWVLLLLSLLPAAIGLSLAVLSGARGMLLLPILAGTGVFELGYAVLLGFALALI